MAAPQKNSQESLADKLADVYTAGRTDLEVHRQIHDDQPVYILHDPQGFQSHRFSVADYRVFSALRDDIPLSQVLQNLIDAGMLTEENKDDFYRFVVALRMLNLLKHTDASSKELYEKYQRTDAASKQGGVMRLLSIKIPLVNPDAFLTRTIPLASIFFSRGFFALWVVCGLFALLTVLRRASDFAEPLNGVLSAGNIPYFLFSLIGLKVWHELGHGYACKHFGGRVPEMGTILMMGMPLAYVDASATWSFKRRYQRLIVMLGGMYFESMLAIGAVFVWASAGHSFLGSCAYQTILTASVVTVLFNANPLMRYDGYFVLVELLGLTNLRQLATTELKQWSKKLFLGIQPKADSGQKPWMRWSALLYGICSGVYSNMLAFGIAAVLAYKLPQFGIMIAAYYLYATFGKKLFALASYLRSSEETKEIKGRGRLVFGLAFVALPLIVAGFPAPTSNSVGGLLSAEHEERVRSKSQGLFSKMLIHEGDMVVEGQPVTQLENVVVESDLVAADADVRHMTLIRDSYVDVDHSKYVQLTHAVNRSRHQRDERFSMNDDLTVRTNSSGIVAQALHNDDTGRMIESGEVVCTIIGGAPRLRAYLTEDQLVHASISPGSSVSFCFAGQSNKKYLGRVIDFAQASVNEMEDRALTQAGGESILIDSATGKTVEKVYLVQIDASSIGSDSIEYGRRATVRFHGKYEPLIWYIVRKITDFSRRLDSQS